MKNPRPFSALYLAVFLSLFAFAGNATTAAAPAMAKPQAKRIAEHPDAYAALPAATQKELAEGIITKGQNMKLVYLALGRPDVIVTTPDAKTITWTYRNYVSPVIATNKVVTGNAPMTPLSNSSPLNDTFDAWNNKLLKHDEFGGPRLSALDRIAAKAPTQSWADYGKYRLKIAMSNNPAEISSLNKRAEVEYEDAVRLPPISSPDPMKLDVVFINQLVSDAIIDDSFSAFSVHAVGLSGVPAPSEPAQK